MPQVVYASWRLFWARIEGGALTDGQLEHQNAHAHIDVTCCGIRVQDLDSVTPGRTNCFTN